MKILAAWQPKVALLTVLVLGTAALAVTAVRGQAQPAGRAQNPINPATALLTESRDRLAICVQGVGAAQSSAAGVQQQLQQALAEARNHPNWARAGLARRAPTVDLGCPSAPHLLQPGVEYVDGVPGQGAIVNEPRVQVASPYRLFVFLVPEQELKRVIGSSTIRTYPQEMLCAGLMCAEATTGLYLTPEEANDRGFVVERLLKGVGLEQRVSPGRPAGLPTLTPPAPPTGTPRTR